MEIFSRKKQAFSLVELLFCLTLLALVVPTLSLSLGKHLRKKSFLADIENLQSQLQMAHDFVLHDQILAKIGFTCTPNGTLCQIEFENKRLENKLPTKKHYLKLHHMEIDHKPISSDWNFICSFSGGLKKNVTITLWDQAKKHQRNIELKGYPHVIDINS